MLPNVGPRRKTEYKIRIMLQENTRRKKKTFSGRSHQCPTNIYFQKERPLPSKRDREKINSYIIKNLKEKKR